MTGIFFMSLVLTLSYVLMYLFMSSMLQSYSILQDEEEKKKKKEEAEKKRLEDLKREEEEEDNENNNNDVDNKFHKR